MMPEISRSLLSDNTGPGAAAVLDAIVKENLNEAAPYGDDATTERLHQRCSEFFETEVDVYPVATGTAANALSMAGVVPSDAAILCARHAHIYESESGAVEMFTGGARLVPLATIDAKIDATTLSSETARLLGKSDAFPAPLAVSVSQATELGTLYATDEILTIADVCQQRALALHMDGARLFHALAAAGRSPADMTWRAGVDLLSFGMTKCGALFGEVVVVFVDRLSRTGRRRTELSEVFRRRRRRGGHAVSKMRFVSAQMLALLEGERWKSQARHCNAMARRLERVLNEAGITACYPVQTNQVFATLSPTTTANLRAAGWAFKDWPAAGPNTRRFVTSALTTPESLRALATDLTQALR